MAIFKAPSNPFTAIEAPTAAELVPKFKPQAEALALLEPELSPAEYLGVLEENQLSMDGVNMLAHGLPEQESVWWACQCSQQVSDKLNVVDQAALSAAESWVKDPTPAAAAAAAEAAAATDLSGPGGWAAQAAAWSVPPAAPAVELPATAAAEAPGLVGAAVAGSVLLAAGLVERPDMPEFEKPQLEIPTNPLESAPEAPLLELVVPEVEVPEVEVPEVDQEKLTAALQPFVDIGKEVASGTNTWL